jgi:hypothetical protein
VSRLQAVNVSFPDVRRGAMPILVFLVRYS